MRRLNPRYQILKYSIPFKIPGFEKSHSKFDRTLSNVDIKSEDWFDLFIQEFTSSFGSRYLPICRLSDGEFLFICGRQKRDYDNIALNLVTTLLFYLRQFLTSNDDFEANTSRGVSSGKYSRIENENHKIQYLNNLKKISEDGILALHLSYSNIPFHEHYFPFIKSEFDRNSILITNSNYYPFYFVYAALSGNRRAEIFRERRVLVIHGSEGEKKNTIINSLLSEGVAEVFWHQISSSRSLFDVIEIAPYLGKVDFVLVGAGIGKPNILVQLKPLKVPCIDAGFMFEVWSNPSNASKRPFCKPDNQSI